MPTVKDIVLFPINTILRQQQERTSIGYYRQNGKIRYIQPRDVIYDKTAIITSQASTLDLTNLHCPNIEINQAPKTLLLSAKTEKVTMLRCYQLSVKFIIGGSPGLLVYHNGVQYPMSHFNLL